MSLSAKFVRCIAFGAVLVALLPALSVQAAHTPLLVPTPDRGIQPRLFTGEDGSVHLLYFRKRINDPRNREGDLYYRQYRPESADWTAPVRVSSQSFGHLDAIGRAGFAVAADGSVHVMWFQTRPEAQYYYSRSDPQRQGFSERLAVAQQYQQGLDASGDIAVRGSRVVLSWAAGDLLHEDSRSVYARMSEDAGASFGDEFELGDASLGACACCSLATEFTAGGQLLLAYRSAINNGGRHMQLLSSDLDDPGSRHYRPVSELHQWEIYACPVSSNDLLATAAGNWLVSETRARIVLDLVPAQQTSPRTWLPLSVAEPLSETRQKNPAIAVSEDGVKLVVWAEAISYRRGGALNFRVLDDNGEVLAAETPQLEIPDYSFPAAAVLPDGTFMILY